jgi:signal transduction histidine kinase
MKGRLRILIVEDDPDAIELLSRELGKADDEIFVEAVGTADAFHAALDRREWDLVLSEWSLSTFGAIAALDALRSRELDLPFIVVSRRASDDVAVEAMRAGARDFLTNNKLARLLPSVEREVLEAAYRRERNKMREQLMVSDRMASVGILASGVAHEINNPLASVVINLDLAMQHYEQLLKGNANASREVLEGLADAHDSALRIRDMARDLRLFSRSESDEVTAIKVEPVIESALRMARNEVRHRAKVVKKYAPIPEVVGSESRLGQVILNLVINAAHALPEGRVDENEITIATSVAEDDRVVVEISDTGAGIAPEVLAKIFTPFFAAKPEGFGTGLGLSLCQSIVGSLGGEITVRSAVGHGTTFRVELVAAKGSWDRRSVFPDLKATRASDPGPHSEGKTRSPGAVSGVMPKADTIEERKPHSDPRRRG